ncbi:MAG: translation elongation factor Ts [Planctomycetota bacterium]
MADTTQPARGDSTDTPNQIDPEGEPMTQINAKDVMALRNRTGLGMMDCKKALMEADGNPERAEELLRKKLKGKMETRSDRAAGEGRIGIAVSDAGATIVELSAETDFTAKNETFVEATDKSAASLLAAGAGKLEPNDEVTALIDNLRITTGENISFARGEKLEGGSFASYIHFDGKTGVLLQFEGDISGEASNDICLHIAAADPAPLGVSPDEIPADVVEKERKFRLEQAVESGKPQEIAEKMVEGGMRKFYAEVALLEQPFVKDGKTPIKQLVGTAKVIAFRKWRVGETN